MKIESNPSAVGALLFLLSAAPSLAQTVVATDETMGVQLVEIRDWNMSATVPPENWDKGLWPTSAFACGRAVSISTTIHSDPSSNGNPYVHNFVRTNRLPNLKNERGGRVEVNCYEGSPRWMEIFLSQMHLDPGQTTFFITATLQRKTWRFESPTGRRGWMKFEYY